MSGFYKRTQDLYWQTPVSESAGNARRLWNTLSAVMGKKKFSAIRDELTADLFLASFEKKVNDVRDSTRGSDPPEYHEFKGTNLDEYTVLSVEEVCTLIKKSPNKTCSLDPAPTWLVKDFSQLLSPFVTALFNKSLIQGHFPLSFRKAEVTPILKKSTLDATIPENYRPVSNLQFLSKLLERSVNDQLLIHLGTNGLLPEHQSAYRRCHSTETALLRVTSDALLAADRGMVTLLGMLDLSSAFDCVNHQILLNRLEHSFGISSAALSWIRTYLDDRVQRVRYGGATTGWSSVACGVPQGSVLGPLFFISYSSGVFDMAAAHGFKIHGYADDLQIYDHSRLEDIDTLSARLGHCVESIGVWMASNRLRLNAAKTEVILLGSSSRLKNCTFKEMVIAGNNLQLAKNVRNLGVIIDSSLSFSDHISKIVSTCYYHIRQLRTIRQSLTVDACHALARALILSRLDYCNALLSGISSFLVDKLDGVLRAAARLVLQLPRTSHVTNELRDRLHWLDIRPRIEFKLCVITYRSIHGLAPTYLANSCILVSSHPGRSGLRSAANGDMYIPACKSATLGSRAFDISGPRAFNSLPVETRNCDSLPAFRKKLKTVLFARMIARS